MDRVVVAMSGGVDSSCAAYILTRQCSEVIGVTLRLFDGVSAEKAMDDAALVCRILGIPHRILDARSIFHETVVDVFHRAYRSGLTPSPCLICNPRIKWAFIREALDLGPDCMFATGHYAVIGRTDTGKPVLQRGLVRDQSYFLSRLNAWQIQHTLFPIGEMAKDQVREMVRSAGLPVADRPDSQEVCFIHTQKYSDYLDSLYVDETPPPGDIVDTSGRIRGTHKGLHHYTVGQRQGLGIAAPQPLYVMCLDVPHNRLIVGSKEEAYSARFMVIDTIWSAIDPPTESLACEVQVRYQHKPTRCIVYPLDPDRNRYHVELLDSTAVIAPGQGAAFYQNSTVLGGGEIAPGSPECF